MSIARPSSHLTSETAGFGWNLVLEIDNKRAAFKFPPCSERPGI